MKYALFTDNLSDLDIDQVCEEVKKHGFDGIDITLRPGGHVVPENVEMGLSRAYQVATRAGIEILMASTAITGVDSPNARNIIKSCGHYGVRQIKLGYWRYHPFGTLIKQIDAARRKLEKIIKLTSHYRIQPCVHVHSGDILANGGAILYLILKEFDPNTVGAYVDPMHMTVEGGLSGWEMGLDLVAPWVSLVGMKNFHWIPVERDRHGQMQFRSQYVPLADGQAPLPSFMRRLKDLQYDGTVSLHSEYKGSSSFRILNSTELMDQSAEDLVYLKSVFP
ncbi:MAG: TIM barrel protein [Planctomycetes bacterium]|nr:TIM barrel protein [Planctomycetota bacterium]